MRPCMLLLCLVMHLREQHSHAAPACRLFGLLEWRAGTLALGGTAALTWQFPFCAAFADLPHAQREQLLLSWANSRLLVFQKARRPSCPCKMPAARCAAQASCAKRCAVAQAFKGIKSLLLNTVLSGVDECGKNPIWPALAYPGAHYGALVSLCRQIR